MTQIGAKTLAEINALNEAFWRERQATVEKQLTDPEVLQMALWFDRSESQRAVQVYSRRPLEEVLEIFAFAKKNNLSAFSAKGGKTPKLDPITGLINEYLKNSPAITARRLEVKLRQAGYIVEAEGREVIQFEEADGRKKTALLSGLKDRLHRLRKIDSR